MFVIGPDKKVKLILVYPMTTGRNFDEVLRVIDSLQMTAKHKVATPVNWQQGEDVIIAGSVSDEDAQKTYPQGWKAPKPYIRISTAAAVTEALVPQWGTNLHPVTQVVATSHCASKSIRGDSQLAFLSCWQIARPIPNERNRQKEVVVRLDNDRRHSNDDKA